MAKSGFSSSEHGFSIVETLFATGLMATALVALAQMFSISVANNASARAGTYATVLAEQKMEQLRGLTWGFDTLGLPASDTTTNTASPIESSVGGVGLSPSPADTLTHNTNGYVDYVDQFGNIIGGGTSIPANAVYVRRWSIEPLPTNPNNTLVIQVLVIKGTNRRAADNPGSSVRLRDEARIISMKTRKAQ